MVLLTDKRNCCGCSACFQICPTKCITMQEDNEGFLYPQINPNKCIECGKCVSVCIINKKISSQNINNVYAGTNHDDAIRNKSSSGGIFAEIAKHVINQKGIVFGAKFNINWEVIHDYTDNMDQLSNFYGSKYIQSNIGQTYSKAKHFLEQGRIVLFSGTPCQIAGLNFFLNKKYDNLIALDFVCHSIPSPKVWRLYRNKVLTKISIEHNLRESYFSHISFRSKVFGWNDFHFEAIIKDEKREIKISQSHKINPYMSAFLNDLSIRPVCTNCPVRNHKSGADITLADFWGVEKYHPKNSYLMDNKGASIIITYSDTGNSLLKMISKSIYLIEIPYEEVEEDKLHSPITKSAAKNRYRTSFFNQIDKIDIEKNIKTNIRKGYLTKKRKKIIKNSSLYIIGKDIYMMIKSKRI